MSGVIEKLMELGKAYGWNVSDYEDRRTTENLDAMEMAEQEFRAALHSALPNKAAADVLEERQRQIHAEGWTPEHDDEHAEGEMAAAAASYALAAYLSHFCELPGAPWAWPWSLDWWKPGNDPRRMLVKAGALILAEIERMDRADAKGGAA